MGVLVVASFLLSLRLQPDASLRSWPPPPARRRLLRLAAGRFHPGFTNRSSGI